ncbi:unnamed protein product [Aphanomyces euteiches]|uniref:Zinc finger PHD-type domain-containing protein n=2 Tax=Aphanomyces euteiches TaxID=100861 RepID=A0A6G0XJ56_9STRA|nr:hypothetical protein Ae201684_004382 [Aphanomyces euteiches]KAH9093411.1 hypothetical protein Ae201684P_016041 [Aphanomyces euteiches]
MTKRDECRNCQFSLFDPATGQCKVCDYILNKQRSRPCAACSKPNCQFFCDTCGSGYHRRCAEKNRVHMVPLDDNEVSVVCPSCEKDDANNEVNCGGCHKEFANEEAGLQVGQLVLVEFDMVLYNAVVMEVNERETSVKIHFVRWSKSFDGWYQMDDERVNESLACDGCNKWFHIACLPPIKSTGRYKAASYVCESCFKEAKSNRNKGRPTAEPTPVKEIRSRKVIVSDDESSDDNQDNDDTIVLSPSALVDLPELPKRKVGRPSHKQLEAERLALAKRKAILKSIKEAKAAVSPRPVVEKRKESSEPVRVAKSPRLRDATKDTKTKSPPPPPSPKRKPPTDRSATATAPPPPSLPSSPKQRKTKSKPSPKVVPAKPASPVPTLTTTTSTTTKSSTPADNDDDDSKSSEDERPPPVKKKKKLRDNQTETDLPLVPSSSMLPLQRLHVPKGNSNSSLILLSTLLNSPRYDKHNQENCPPRSVTPLDILHVVASQNIPPPPPPASPPPPLPPGPAPPALPVQVHGPETGIDYDMHFCLREEMYRHVCEMEEAGHLMRETATLLRAWTHPTSSRFQDLRFVYLVNKHMSRGHLAARLSEITRKYGADQQFKIV